MSHDLLTSCLDSQGGALIFSSIGRLWSFFEVQILNFHIGGGGGGGGSEKMNSFGGMKILWIFLGSSQNWIIFRGYFYATLCFFLTSRCRIGDRFLGC